MEEKIEQNRKELILKAIDPLSPELIAELIEEYWDDENEMAREVTASLP